MADVPPLLELMRALAVFEGYIDEFRVDEPALLVRAFGADPQCQVFVAEQQGQLLGYAVVLEIAFTFDLRPTLLLKELYVAEGQRGSGLGKALLQQVSRFALSIGAGRLKWDVLTGNGRAEAFYQRLGGRPDSKWTGYRMGVPELEQLALASDA
ncbi:GNAT family N-acetyltransferase [Phytopseudomonas flavescens]|uniref:GNAT family N-acetyltransferase n=1 Tax=Phytopseudomonas flavescens TaxID=29435 RepID=UPI001FC9473B|nr:GNAT family N-acetyltransferase [Pseudomonas flavescens]